MYSQDMVDLLIAFGFAVYWTGLEGMLRLCIGLEFSGYRLAHG